MTTTLVLLPPCNAEGTTWKGSDAMINLTCPVCGDKLSCPDKEAGSIAYCQCGEPLRIPGDLAAPADILRPGKELKASRRFWLYYALAVIIALAAVGYAFPALLCPIVIPLVVAFAVSIIAAVAAAGRARMLSEMSPHERASFLWGAINPPMICPHCQKKGCIRTMPVRRKKGISGAKATGAILTGGLSLLATGLSREEDLTQAHCMVCNCTWEF